VLLLVFAAMRQSHKDKMKPLPMLKQVRESRDLSQRALAKISGVAHDTISQIERGERLARSSTAQKLADALRTHPLTLSIGPEHLESFDEYMEEEAPPVHTARAMWEALEYYKNEVSDNPELVDALDWIRNLAIESGDVSAAVTWKEAKAAAGYEDLLEQVDEAYKKLNPPRDTPYEDQLVDVAEATLLLARASAQLIQLVTRELESDAPWVTKGLESNDPYDHNNEVNVERYREQMSKFASLNNPLVEAWFEGCAATKGFIDITDKALRPLGESALESASENGGGDQEEAATER
jgi:transcriptional regulator with XRE-family HTH domain